MGRRKRERQQEFRLATSDVAQASRHMFDERLGALMHKLADLIEAEFDEFIKKHCEERCADELGRPGDRAASISAARHCCNARRC